ncbi:DUF3619 family protein [Ottowia sp.]|uniref:DUF3619 family protein n=1 Tax=Ottowia sp. TaxID=1898956 RepID=UPI002BEE1F7F|nr:DUF3619 family protein [Ottowia sp.]HOB67145.1 DUF3619 family protein [Ottowia sp.]HPZ57590.1 DUF3619 family protein [Ottowia sp.]HQD48524.1 DUF3619 family protein [Ottowia sp.]
MNTNYSHLHHETLQNRFGLRVAARLSNGAEALPHDIGERLRVAREQALARRKQPAAVAHRRVASAVSRNGSSATLSFGDDGLGFWGRMASAALVLVMAAGLVVINVTQTDNRTLEVANVDAALLTDDLPPEAYADPGFLQYLKAGSAGSNAPAGR